MAEGKRQFDYNPDTGMLKLRGVLCIILAPLSLWMSFQDGGQSGGLWLFGKGWFAFIPAPQASWVIRLLSLVLVWVGYLIFTGARQQKKFAGRIHFTPTGLIFEADPADGSDNEIKYQDISNVPGQSEKGKRYSFSSAGAKSSAL